MQRFVAVLFAGCISSYPDRAASVLQSSSPNPTPCSLAGEQDAQGKCKCDPGFHGQECQLLKFGEAEGGRRSFVAPKGSTTWGGCKLLRFFSFSLFSFNRVEAVEF